ncbi:hypothetical protein Y032_0663g1307 [Ancylostoma ceylanicum]|nr:hypothetical protein Y032_0663g1307 [Ancylostoma ceylanicum]
MRMNAAGLTDFYDEMISDVQDADECEQKCVARERVGDPCRSYTYDKLTKLCYISHQDSRSSGRSPLATRNANLVHGTLDDCIDFALKCRNDALEIHGLSMRLFSGSMKTKRRKDVICEKEVAASYDFTVQMPYRECGIEETETPFRSHSGVVHVKEGSTNLITIRDKILQVNCHIHSQTDISNQMLTAQMIVNEPNTTYRTLSNNIIYVPSQSPRPRYSLSVLNADGIETDVVRYGEHGWLSLKVNDESESHIFVSNMKARVINSEHTINLIGDDGCVTHRNYIMGISRPSPREIRYKINFGGFDEKAQFVYQALVETCRFDCWPKCNQELWLDDMEKKELSDNNLRVKRAVGPRQIELIQDIYKVHGGRITILTPLSPARQLKELEIKSDPDILEKELLQEEGVQVEMVWLSAPYSATHLYPENLGLQMNNQPITSALRHCFSNDVTCLFTVILAAIQLFLLASCICIVYCYIQQWRAYRNSMVSTPAQVQYQLNEATSSSKTEARRVE